MCGCGCGSGLIGCVAACFLHYILPSWSSPPPKPLLQCLKRRRDIILKQTAACRETKLSALASSLFSPPPSSALPLVFVVHARLRSARDHKFSSPLQVLLPLFLTRDVKEHDMALLGWCVFVFGRAGCASRPPRTYTAPALQTPAAAAGGAPPGAHRRSASPPRCLRSASPHQPLL